VKRVALAIVVVVVLVAVVAWRVWSRRDTTAPPRAPVAGSGVVSGSAGTATPTPTPRESRVRKLAADERRALGDKIKAAIAKSRAATASVPSQPGAAPALPDEPNIPLEEVGKPLFDALKESIPLVAECYEKHGTAKEAAAMMMMISDPELGTVIDTEAITDRDGKPIDPKLDDCMRNTIDSLALPPLGKPGKLKVQFTFKLTE